jgi:hypothetical protein
MIVCAAESGVSTLEILATLRDVLGGHVCQQVNVGKILSA